MPSDLIHGDPLDPNDRVRQQTQGRSKAFPYDRPVSYGAPEGQDMGGAKYQQPGYGGQLTPWFMPNDDGDIETEAIGTPYNYAQSDGGSGNGLRPPGGSRSFAGPHKDNLDVEPIEVFGEDEWPGEVRRRRLVALDGEDFMDLRECFAVHDDDGDEVISLLETLDWDE